MAESDFLINFKIITQDMSEKEYDNKMHTAEHILNSVMNRKFGCGRSFRSHIEKKKSKCDYKLGRPITDSEIKEVEADVNKIIALDIELTEEYVTRTEAEAHFFTGKLPADAGDRIRIVKIANYDACPCIGPHVKRTSEVGFFSIATADWDQNIQRVRFKLQ
jgi:misacylated tRNA(Ala) deacylase